MKKSSLGFGNVFNVLQSLIGRTASRPHVVPTFLSNQMYLCISLVERKVAEMTYFHCFFRKIDGVLTT